MGEGKFRIMDYMDSVNGNTKVAAMLQLDFNRGIDEHIQ